MTHHCCARWMPCTWSGSIMLQSHCPQYLCLHALGCERLWESPTFFRAAYETIWWDHMVSFIVFECGVGAEQKICSTDCLAGCVLLKWREKMRILKKIKPLHHVVTLLWTMLKKTEEATKPVHKATVGKAQKKLKCFSATLPNPYFPRQHGNLTCKLCPQQLLWVPH